MQLKSNLQLFRWLWQQSSLFVVNFFSRCFSPVVIFSGQSLCGLFIFTSFERSGSYWCEWEETELVQSVGKGGQKIKVWFPGLVVFVCKEEDVSIRSVSLFPAYISAASLISHFHVCCIAWVDKLADVKHKKATHLRVKSTNRADMVLLLQYACFFPCKAVLNLVNHKKSPQSEVWN